MKRFSLTIALLFCLAQQIFAVGALYARRPLTEDDYRPIWLKTLTINVHVTDQMAITHVDHVFQNETNNPLEGVFIFPLPDEAFVTSLIVWVDGIAVEASIQDSDTARATYENDVKSGLSPALLEDLGNNIFKLSVYPIDEVGQPMSERRIELTYAELLTYKNGNIGYRFHNKTNLLSSKEIELTNFNFSVNAQNEVLDLASPSHPTLTTQRHSADSLTATYTTSNSFSSNDIILNYSEKSDTFTINHLTYVPDTMFFDTQGVAETANKAFLYYTWDTNPYVLFWITPPDTTTNQITLAKEIVFVADISESMKGTRLSQLKASLHEMVTLLNDGDKFNIILFNSTTQTYSDTLVIATAASKSATSTFINDLTAMGLTNFEKAFEDGLQYTFSDTTMNALVFLTDGEPTWPVTTSHQKVYDNLTTLNSDNVKVFTFGIGQTIDKSFLHDLAVNNSGYSTIILEDDSITSVMGNFMREISHPLITNLMTTFGGQGIYDGHPNNLPDLYDGSQLTFLARYTKTGAFTTGVTGNTGGSTINFDALTTYPSPKGNHPFVARMWASSIIKKQLSDIEMYGEQDSLIALVIATSLRYAILTPYTSFLVEDPGTVTPVVDYNGSYTNNVILKLISNTTNPRVSLSIPKQVTPKQAILRIYDLKGRLIATLLNEYTLGGSYSIALAPHNLAKGLYIAVLNVGNIQQIVKLRF